MHKERETLYVLRLTFHPAHVDFGEATTFPVPHDHRRAFRDLLAVDELTFLRLGPQPSQPEKGGPRQQGALVAGTEAAKRPAERGLGRSRPAAEDLQDGLHYGDASRPHCRGNVRNQRIQQIVVWAVVIGMVLAVGLSLLSAFQ